jgi:hypothetical protein
MANLCGIIAIQEKWCFQVPRIAKLVPLTCEAFKHLDVEFEQEPSQFLWS